MPCKPTFFFTIKIVLSVKLSYLYTLLNTYMKYLYEHAYKQIIIDKYYIQI